MKRLLIHSAAFSRAVKRIGKKNTSVSTAILEAVAILHEDAFDPRLRTHKLKGELAGFWSCSAGYDLRIVFDIVPHDGQEAILLVSCGTHDQVY